MRTRVRSSLERPFKPLYRSFLVAWLFCVILGAYHFLFTRVACIKTDLSLISKMIEIKLFSSYFDIKLVV